MTVSICFDSDAITFSERFFILIMWNDTDTPLAYFISFRSYGTWLHDDKRGSIDRFHNRYGDPYIPPNATWQRHNRRQLKTAPFTLGVTERGSVEKAIRDTCRIRKWDLLAFNFRTNHVHTVVTANRKPELVLNAFKANATRQLRENRLWPHTFSPWADKGSKYDCGMNEVWQMVSAMSCMVRAMICRTLMIDVESRPTRYRAVVLTFCR